MGTTAKGIRYIDPDLPIRRVAEYQHYMAEDIDELLDTIPEGPAGAPGPPGVPGGSDAATAAWLAGGALTKKQLPKAIAGARADVDRALRTWYTNVLKADTTAVDIFVGPSDSIGAGAYAGAGAKKFISVTRDKLRRALQPSGIVGGYGYYNTAANPILTGEGFVGSTGGITVVDTFGLGRRGTVLAPGATLSFYFVGTSAKLIYRKDPTYGNFTYTVDGIAGPGPVAGAGAAGSAEVALGPFASGIHTIVVTAVGTTGIEGVFGMDGDETKGIRIFEGSHAGYGAADFVANQAWAASLDRIPNCKLNVIPLGSNDYYNGRTVAQAKADLLTVIGLNRARFGADVSIVLMAYYERPPGAAIVPWSDYVAMYHEIADADDNICVFDAGPLFGTMTGPTDDRGGLTTAIAGDYVHPTPAGHQLLGTALADFLMPPGAAGAGGAANFLPDNLKPASTPQLTAMQGDQAPVYAAAHAGGPIALSGFHIATYGGYELTLTNNVNTFSAANRPAGLTASRTGSFWMGLKQDATGNRVLTVAADVLKAAGVPAIVLSTAPNAYDLIECRWTGTRLIITNFLKGIA